jgi:acyl-CoA thioesterase II
MLSLPLRRMRSMHSVGARGRAIVIDRALSGASARLLRPGDLQASALDLDEVDVDLFVAPQKHLWVPAGGVGVYGGQVIGQALHAAALTSAEPTFELHSMHAYFLRPGNPQHPIVYTVKRTRDGRSFASRSVEASQRGKVIFKCAASFHKAEASPLDHQACMPEVPPPDQLEPFDYERLVRSLLRRQDQDAAATAAAANSAGPSANTDTSDASSSAAAKRDAFEQKLAAALDQPFQVDVRWVSKNPAALEPRPARQLAWIKTARALPTNAPHLHRAVAAFYCDMHLLATALLPHGVGFPSPRLGTLASLDHSMWFHAPFAADAWMLMELESPRLCGGRGLSFGRLYRPDGVLAVSCAQEGLVRLAT